MRDEESLTKGKYTEPFGGGGEWSMRLVISEWLEEIGGEI